MKRRFWIILALAALILALGCGGALAAERRISGTVNVSTLPDFCSVILTDDTTLVVDTDKTLESIKGTSCSLTIEGDHDIKLYSDTAGIEVKTLLVNLDGLLWIDMNHGSSITIAPWTAAIKTSGDILMSCNVRINGEEWGGGIHSTDGNIDVSGSFTSNTTNSAFLAESGSISLSGNMDMTMSTYMLSTISAEKDFVFRSGKLTLNKRGGIKSKSGNIELHGEVHIITTNHASSGSIVFNNILPVNAVGGNVFLQGQITINCGSADASNPDGFPCIQTATSFSPEANNHHLLHSSNIYRCTIATFYNNSSSHHYFLAGYVLL